MNTTYTSNDYFQNLDKLTNRDWHYKLAKLFPVGGVTNAKRIIQVEVLNEKSQDDFKSEIHQLLKVMQGEYDNHLMTLHQQTDHVENQHTTASSTETSSPMKMFF